MLHFHLIIRRRITYDCPHMIYTLYRLLLLYSIQTLLSLMMYVNSLKCAPSSLHLPRSQTFAVPQNVAGLTQVAQDFTLNQFFWHFFFVVFGSSINQQRSSDNDFQFSVCHTHTHTQSSPEMWQRIKNSLSGLQTLFESALSVCLCVYLSLYVCVCLICLCACVLCGFLRLVFCCF